MNDLLLFLAFVVVWFLLPVVVLPRLGVPAWAVPTPAGRRGGAKSCAGEPSGQDPAGSADEDSKGV